MRNVGSVYSDKRSRERLRLDITQSCVRMCVHIRTTACVLITRVKQQAARARSTLNASATSHNVKIAYFIIMSFCRREQALLHVLRGEPRKGPRIFIPLAGSLLLSRRHICRSLGYAEAEEGQKIEG